jgi:hypothetical protein
MRIAKWMGFAYILWLIVGLFLPRQNGKGAAGSALIRVPAWRFGSGHVHASPAPLASQLDHRRDNSLKAHFADALVLFVYEIDVA